MKKFFKFLFSCIVILFLGGLLTWTFLPKILSYTLSKTAGVKITISDIHFSQNALEIHGIKIHNPPGYSKTPQALLINRLIIKTPLTRFFDKKICIDAMIIETPYVGLEFDTPQFQRGNWATLIESVKRSEQKGSHREKRKGKGRSIFIQHLIFKNLQLEIGYKMANQPNKKLRPIDRIELTNVRSEEGTKVLDLIIEQIFQNILTEEGLQNLLDKILNPKKSVKETMHFFKDLFSNETQKKPSNQEAELLEKTTP